MSSETLPVDFRLIGVERVFGGGKLAALAVVEIDVAGVAITLQGVRVVREPSGLAVRAPAFRDAAGIWRSAVILPDTLAAALASEVLEQFR